MAQHTSHDQGHADGHHGFAHVMPIPILFGVFFALLFLTFLTTWISANVTLGEYELPVSMGIATLKAGLVVLFFMHMIHDKPFNAAIMAFSLFFAALFIGFTLLDKMSYDSQVQERVYDEIRVEEGLK